MAPRRQMLRSAPAVPAARHGILPKSDRGTKLLPGIAPAEEAGYFCFEFEIDGRTVKRRTETSLSSLAIYRARRAIDRELKRRSEA